MKGIEPSYSECAKSGFASARPCLRTSKAVHRCQDAVLDDGGKRHGVGLAVKPSVRISLDLARIAEPKINLANGVARSKVATPRARMNPRTAITRDVTGTRDALVPCASPFPAHPLTNLAAYLSSEYRGREGRRKQGQRHCAHGCHEHKRRQSNFRADLHGCRGDLRRGPTCHRCSSRALRLSRTGMTIPWIEARGTCEHRSRRVASQGSQDETGDAKIERNATCSARLDGGVLIGHRRARYDVGGTGQE